MWNLKSWGEMLSKVIQVGDGQDSSLNPAPHCCALLTQEAHHTHLQKNKGARNNGPGKSWKWPEGTKPEQWTSPSAYGDALSSSEMSDFNTSRKDPGLVILLRFSLTQAHNLGMGPEKVKTWRTLGSLFLPIVCPNSTSSLSVFFHMKICEKLILGKKHEHSQHLLDMDLITNRRSFTVLALDFMVSRPLGHIFRKVGFLVVDVTRSRCYPKIIMNREAKDSAPVLSSCAAPLETIMIIRERNCLFFWFTYFFSRSLLNG